MYSCHKWIALSLTFAALTACNNVPTTNTSSTSSHTSDSNHQTSSKVGDPDVKYMTKLGLMKGHLLVAKELLDLGKPDLAEPHIGHPVEEIYADLEPQLKERKIKEFKTTLTSLHELVKANPKDPKLKSLFVDSEAKIANAIASLPADKRQSPKFVLQVVGKLADVADSEYQAAISNGKVAEVVEYQDSRGFIVYADTLYQGISTKMTQEYPQVHQELTASIKELKTVWPSVVPPTKPIKTPEEVSQLVNTVEQNIKKVVN